jgi:hypothetical protein
MNGLKSFFVWAVLLVVLYATWQVIAADGWRAGGIFLLILLVFAAIVGGIHDILTAPFRSRRSD